MKRFHLLLLSLFCFAGTQAQQVIFDDGTTVNVNQASFDYENIRKLSAGFILNLDGLAGDKLFTASFLQPEKFHIASNIGFSSANIETSIFLTGKTKEKKKGFGVKYASGGANTIKRYVLNANVRKRKEIALFLGINDYGHLLKEEYGVYRSNHYPVMKQTKVYAGVSTVNYWHSHVDVDDNFLRRGQFIGRTILAPFVTFASVADTVGHTLDDAPRYGARLMYELSNTFGLLGAKIRGRTNFILRFGIDVATDKNKKFYRETIFGIGMVFNFVDNARE